MAVSVSTEAYNEQVSQLTKLNVGNVTRIILLLKATIPTIVCVNVWRAVFFFILSICNSCKRNANIMTFRKYTVYCADSGGSVSCFGSILL